MAQMTIQTLWQCWRRKHRKCSTRHLKEFYQTICWTNWLLQTIKHLLTAAQIRRYSSTDADIVAKYLGPTARCKFTSEATLASGHTSAIYVDLDSPPKATLKSTFSATLTNIHTSQ